MNSNPKFLRSRKKLIKLILSKLTKSTNEPAAILSTETLRKLKKLFTPNKAKSTKS